MTAAQASVGSAATWPTTGTILSAAEVTRQGAASTPQPDSEQMSGRQSSTKNVDFMTRAGGGAAAMD